MSVGLGVVQTAIVLVTVRVGLAQLRDGRRAAQFTATRGLVSHVVDPQFYGALQVVEHELPARLADPAYARELAASRGWDVDAARHPELLVLARLEEIGTYVKYRLVAADALFDYLGELVVGTDLTGDAGFMTPEEGARLPVAYALLGADAVSGRFVAASGETPW